MKRFKTPAQLMRLGTAAALCLIAAWPARADEAPKRQPAAVVAVQAAKPPETAPTPAATTLAAAPKPLDAPPEVKRPDPPVAGDPKEKELESEISKLQKLEVELNAVESTPLPAVAAPAVKVAVVKPAPNPDAIPKEPVKGLEEEFANTLYAMGKYDRARAAYQQIIESKPKADILAWARLQAANCARHTGDLPEAGAAYEALMNSAPTSPWAPEATWWAGEIKWWVLWGQNTK